ncbi:hypothetical protein SCLAR_v1c08290 [Spiroplasma clarkii]|uniref:Uncharacterized protein n=1 Tax=Spiroplasma clarkii TaxID=2139 RepID=A0A2K8KHI2_9MOLU|nr:hypothetical protein SCLAR_v1c08290 [Spiroplasma clarkii]
MFNALVIVGGIFLAIPFIVWLYCRFQTKIRHNHKHWYKYLILISSLLGITLFIVCFVVAFVIY